MKYIGFPRPSYPLAHIVDPVVLVFCNRKKEKKEKENAVMACADI